MNNLAELVSRYLTIYPDADADDMKRDLALIQALMANEVPTVRQVTVRPVMQPAKRSMRSFDTTRVPRATYKGRLALTAKRIQDLPAADLAVYKVILSHRNGITRFDLLQEAARRWPEVDPSRRVDGAVQRMRQAGIVRSVRA